MKLDKDHPNYPQLESRMTQVVEQVLQWRAQRLASEAAQNGKNGSHVNASGLVATAEVNTVGANNHTVPASPEVLKAGGLNTVAKRNGAGRAVQPCSASQTDPLATASRLPSPSNPAAVDGSTSSTGTG